MAAMRKAFRVAAKLWHPDRFERDPDQRLQAEEHFKGIQAAFRELCEHHENPVEWPVEAAFAGATRLDEAVPLSFGGAPGCFAAPDFSPQAARIIAGHVSKTDSAVAIVDLSSHGSPGGDLSQYILFTLHGIFVRDALNIVSLLWYDDLGEIRFVDQRKNGKLGVWQRMVERLSGTEQKYALEIRRRDGSCFYSIASQADDSVKKVIYNFLQQKKPQPHP
jgi:hypothetical protein